MKSWCSSRVPLELLEYMYRYGTKLLRYHHMYRYGTIPVCVCTHSVYTLCVCTHCVYTRTMYTLCIHTYSVYSCVYTHTLEYELVPRYELVLSTSVTADV